MRKILFISICLLITHQISGQELVNLRVRTVTLPVDSLILDSLSLVPQSFFARYYNGVLIPDSLYIIDYPSAVFYPGSRLNKQPDSIIISFRVFPVSLSSPYQHKKEGFNRIDPVTGKPKTPYRLSGQTDPFAGSQIVSNGNISRGLMVGNTRDPSLSSNMNLQLSGRINNDYMIEANLSDANIPIQPEGNTQQIQDFDRLYMRIYNSNNEVLGGDFFLESPEGYFMKMNKKVQGARISSSIMENPGNGTKLRSSISGAVVKGKYARNKIQGQEGNQGPYRLNGRDGESYIQVVAGSEKVYIDGLPMTRGEQNDYVIDYNTAEIRFTPKVLITKDKRISVEFEYTEQSYARFLIASNTDWERETGKWYLNVFSEKDAKNQPLLQDLSDDHKKILGSIGDQQSKAVVPNYFPVEFRNDRVLYKLTDTIVNGIEYDSILVYSINPDSALYQAGFSFAGENNGDYTPVASAANGQVYQWVAPENGVPQGSYAPYTRLVSPGSKQVFATGGREKLGSRTEMNIEMAITRNDKNTFSSIDDSDNIGYGLISGLKRTDPFGPDSSWQLISSVEYRRTGSQFDPLERFRPVEFERDWNLDEALLARNENFLKSSFTLHGNDSLMANYQLEYLNFNHSYNALRHISNGSLYSGKWSLNWNGSFMNSATDFSTTSFGRHSISITRDFRFMKIIAEENRESNIRRSTGEGDPGLGSFRFQEWKISLESGPTNSLPWYIRFTNRTDAIPEGDELADEYRAMQIESGLNFRSKKGNSTSISANYRRLESLTSEFNGQNDGQTLGARIEENFQLAKGALVSRTFYEIGSGLERKMEYTYVEVAAGQGHYTWADYNQNGYKELEEFEPAHFRDQANFIRVFRPGTAYIPTFQNRLKQVFEFRPGRFFDNGSVGSKILSPFTNSMAYLTDNKSNRSSLGRQLNPFAGTMNDSLVVSNNTQFRNTVSFNKSNPVFGVDYHFEKNQGQTLMSYGTDRRESDLNRLTMRIKPVDMFWITNLLEKGNKEYSSSFFSSKNYLIEYIKNNIELSFKPGDKWQTGLSHEWRKENGVGLEESLQGHRIEASVSYQMPAKGQIQLNLNYLSIRFNGKPDSPAGYVLLQGFRPGHNGLMKLSLRRKLNEIIQLDLFYEGRLSEGVRIIHTGNVQVRAVF